MAMSDEQVFNALKAAGAALITHRYNSDNTLRPRPVENRSAGTQYDQACHLLYMVFRVNEFIREGRREKAMRWLGFIQGSVWSMGLRSIDDMKNDNRPPEEGV